MGVNDVPITDDITIEGNSLYKLDDNDTDSTVAYKTTDSASTTINDTDYVPMSDANGNRKKLLWSNIVDKLKSIFNPPIADIVNVYGAKNLIPYPYHRQSGYTTNGATFTYDDEGIIKVNKVAGNATAYFSLFSNNLFPNEKKFLAPNTSYILSMELEDASNTSCFVSISGVDMAAIKNKATGKYEISFTTPETIDYYSLIVGLYYGAAATETNAKVKLMIRLASIQDDTYVPYAPINRDLMSYKVNGELGAKNLLPYPYEHTTKVDAGITWTDNGDGTITANGTATSDTAFNLNYCWNYNKTFDMKGIPWKVTGQPDDVSTNVAYIQTLIKTSTSSSVSYGNITDNNGAISSPSNTAHLGLRIIIKNGSTVSNLVFKPMIRRIEDTDPTWQPYAKTNKQLTEDASVAYKTTDSASTTINDTDYVPMSDANGNRKKTLWSNIVDKLKAIFLTNFVGTTARWNALSREQKAQYKTTDFKDDSTPSPIDANPIQGSGNAIASGGVYSELVKVKAFTYLGDAQTPKTANTAVTINLSESMDNYVLLYIRYGFQWGWNHPIIVSPSAFGVPCISTCEGSGRIRIDRVSATAIKITTGSYDLGHANNNDRTAVWGIIKK